MMQAQASATGQSVAVIDPSVIPSTSLDIRNPGTDSHYCAAQTKLVSRSHFTVECCGEKTLGSNQNGGKFKLTIPADTHLGKISGNSPVYVSE